MVYLIRLKGEKELDARIIVTILFEYVFETADRSENNSSVEYLIYDKRWRIGVKTVRSWYILYTIKGEEIEIVLWSHHACFVLRSV